MFEGFRLAAGESQLFQEVDASIRISPQEQMRLTPSPQLLVVAQRVMDGNSSFKVRLLMGASEIARFRK